MLEFQKLQKSDFFKLEPYFTAQAQNTNPDGSRLCDYAPGTVRMWCEAYQMKYACSGGSLFLCALFEEGVVSYLLPIGGDPVKSLEMLRDHLYLEGGGHLSIVPEEQLEQVRRVFGETIVENSIQASRDWADYIYEKKAFENPTGRQHHKQKNLINRFLREHPETIVESLTSENAAEVLQYYRSYCLKNPETSSIDGDEFAATADLLRDWENSGMIGAVLRGDFGIGGFTIGEVYGDTVYVHVEKAEKQYPGAFQTLSQNFQRLINDPAVLYVNREEDMGLEGLRRSKMAYCPIRLDYKYMVEISPESVKSSAKTNCHSTSISSK